MASVSPSVKFEIGHVLFIDLVGYSKLLITEQSEQMQKLREIVRGTEQFRLAEAEGKLLRLPTGDGGALVFRTSSEAPVLCALEISKELKKHPDLRVRMGIHSGPVNEITDLNEQANIAGAGINTAQRVMDCGDSGHILLSKHVADDLEQYPQWRSYLHDLGECEVKHGVRIHAVNLHTDEVGNSEVPEKFQKLKEMQAAPASAASEAKPARRSWSWIAALIIVAALGAAAGFYISSRRSGPTAPPSATASAPVAVPEKSIAVLPFENLSEEKANAFFTDGVQDEILTDLAKIADLKVISRTSVMQYKSGVARNLRKIGEELGVAHVVEGSVQRAANRIRVNAQLIDARNDAHLWAQTYDRDLADVFAIQSEIAKGIADQLQAKLSPSEKKAIEQPPTADITAFDLYTRANNVVLANSFSVADRQNLRQAADLLNQALGRDPSFFLAYCRLASAHAQLYFLGDHTPAQLALAEAAVQAAFRLRPDAGEAHLARAENFYRGYLDYNGALAELDIARRTLPNDPRVFELTGYILRRRGKQEEGLQYLQRSLELDPRNFFTLQQIALSYVNLRRYSEEATVLDRGLAIKPDDVETKVARALVDFDWKADTRPLHKTIDSIRAKNPGAMQSVADSWFNCALAERDPAASSQALLALGENTFGIDTSQIGEFSRSFGEGLIARMMRDEVKARAAFTAARAEQQKSVESKVDYGPALGLLGLIDAALGRKEEALREGRRAVELLPVEKDSLNGAAMIEYLALIAAWVGEKDLACEQLAIATQLPGSLSYGQLKLLPYWDPLRGNPRFEKIVASLAPKQ
jgi:TolB-like protein/class 3 adenylate cyclase/Tfp pilus assembly protein PilF